MKALLLCCGFVFFLFGCSSTKELSAEEQLVAARVTPRVEDRDMDFTFRWAYPQADQTLNQLNALYVAGQGSIAGQIYLEGNPNHLSIKRDTISAYLPYYGERRLSGGLGGQATVTFNAIPQDYEYRFDTQKKQHLITFNISNKEERFDISLTVHATGSANLILNSISRTFIKYDGRLEDK